MISCSATKRNLIDESALEVYDGPSYRILRKHPKDDLDILILSAKYGLILASQKISTYNQRMTDHIAHEIRKQTTDRLIKVLSKRVYKEIYVDLGKSYRNAIDFGDPWLKDLNIQFSVGTIGVRLHSLKTWLECDS